MLTFDRDRSELRSRPQHSANENNGFQAWCGTASVFPDLLSAIGNQAAGRLLQAEGVPSGPRVGTSGTLQAPVATLLCSPFDSEPEEARGRRERLIQSIGNAVERLINLLGTGGLIRDTETATERGGVRGVVLSSSQIGTAEEIFVSYADRDVRIRRIVRSLIAMASLYRTAPIPADFSGPSQRETGDYESTVSNPRGTTTFGGDTAEWADLQAAYERYRIAQQGRPTPDLDIDWLYLDPGIRVAPGAARGAPRIGHGIQTGAYMVVPDIEREPLRYFRLDGFTPVPIGSTIVEFWHDAFGYYYMHRGLRIDVPSPWSR